MNDTKPVLAELIGTFTLVFIGAGAGALASATGGGIVAVALAHGIALAVIVYAWGPISGAHVNPAVTFGVALAGRMSWAKAASYWIVQFLGAAVAAFVLVWLIGKQGGLGATTGTLTVSAPLKAAALEAVLTFFLVVAVFGSAIAGRNGNAYGIAIGLVLTMDILMGGSLTGASMNPARTFGPALVTGDVSHFWIYLIGPFAGGGAAGLLYDRVFLR